MDYEELVELIYSNDNTGSDIEKCAVACATDEMSRAPFGFQTIDIAWRELNIMQQRIVNQYRRYKNLKPLTYTAINPREISKEAEDFFQRTTEFIYEAEKNLPPDEFATFFNNLLGLATIRHPDPERRILYKIHLELALLVYLNIPDNHKREILYSLIKLIKVYLDELPLGDIQYGGTLLRSAGFVYPKTGEPTASNTRLMFLGSLMQEAAGHLTRLFTETEFYFERIITAMIEAGLLDNEGFSDPKYFTEEKW